MKVIPVELILQNKDDREVVALALYRAGYTVRERKRKEGGKTVVSLEFWRQQPSGADT